jgi:hypothetical protein
MKIKFYSVAVLLICFFTSYGQSTTPLRPQPIMPKSENLASTHPAEMDIVSTFILSEKQDGQKERLLKWDWQQQGLKAPFTDLRLGEGGDFTHQTTKHRLKPEIGT